MQKSKIIVGQSYIFYIDDPKIEATGKVVEYGGNGSVKLSMGASEAVKVTVDRSHLVRRA